MESLSPAFSCETLIQQLQRLVTSDTYNEFLLIVEENTTLRQQEKNLNITNEQNLKTLGHLQQNLETINEQNAEYSTQIDRLTQEIQNLQSTLDDARESIKTKDEELCENEKSTAKLEADLKQRETDLDNFKQFLHREREISQTANDARKAMEHDLMLLEQERSSLSERLQWLNQFAAGLRKPDRDIIREKLQNMFKHVYDLVVEFFGHDLENSAFQDQANWETLRNHDLLKRIVPLPLSNTTAAKEMRVAALLGICAEAISRHIFQFTYLLDGNQLHELIDAIQSYDWHQGNYLRSVLLRSLPKEQKNNSLARTKRLVAEVLELTKPILSAKRQLLFGDSLLKICRNITEQWMQFQELEAAIEPEFELNDDADDWKLFLLGHIPTRAVNDNAKHSLDPDPKKVNAKLDMTQTNFVLWPAFFISEAGELELLQPGFALGEEQMKPAKSEETAIASRRARQAARKSNRRRIKFTATSRNGVLDMTR